MSGSVTGRKLDSVWHNFEIIKKDGRQGRRARCRKCGFELEGQVARLKKHLSKCFLMSNDDIESEEITGMKAVGCFCRIHMFFSFTSSFVKLNVF